MQGPRLSSNMPHSPLMIKQSITPKPATNSWNAGSFISTDNNNSNNALLTLTAPVTNHLGAGNSISDIIKKANNG